MERLTEGPQLVSARAKATAHVSRLSLFSVLSTTPCCPIGLVLAAAGWPRMSGDKGLHNVLIIGLPNVIFLGTIMDNTFSSPYSEYQYNAYSLWRI